MMAPFTEWFSVTMPCQEFSTIQESTETEEFSHILFFSAVGQRWPHPNLANHNIKDTDLSSLSFSNRPLFYDSFTLSSRRVIIITVYPGSQNKMSSRRAACLGLHTGGGDSSLGHRFVVDQIEREERSWPPYSDYSWQGPSVRWKGSRGAFDHHNWMLW